MYEDFHVTDHWTREDLHCRWTANVVAIATRHADAVDIRFEVNGRPVWIAMPADAWVVQKERSGHVITDRLAAQVAGRYLKQAAESGYDNGREMYTMSVAEVLEQVAAVMAGSWALHPAARIAGDATLVIVGVAQRPVKSPSGSLVERQQPLGKALKNRCRNGCARVNSLT